MKIRQNSVLRMSDENTMKLISLYEEEECLWNTNLASYKSRQMRHEAAERVAKQLGLEHFTARYVIIKFKNLRNSYCQELKKIAKNVSSGDVIMYTPKVFWFNKMDSFLRPHVQQHASKLNNQLSVKPEPPETDWEIAQLSNPGDGFTEETNGCSDSEEIDEEEVEQKRSRNSSTSSKRPRVEESHENELSRIVKDIACHMHVMTTQSQDCYDSFGRYVSAMLRSLPARRAAEVQPQIVNVLVAAVLKSEQTEANETIT